MITLAKNGNAIVFTFSDNAHYLFDGTIEVPVNSLTLITDNSQMATFKKSASNDIFISATYAELGMSKSELESWFKENACGSTGGGGVTSGEVETMIETSLEDYYDIDEVDAALSAKANTATTYTKTEVDTALANKADTSAVTAVNSSLTAHTADTTVHVTSADKTAWNAKSDFSGSYNDLTDKPTIPTVPTSNTAFTNDAGYITSGEAATQIEAATSGKADTTAVTESINAAVSGKADTSSVYTKSEVDTALSGKQDVSGMTAYTTSSDIESYVSGYTYDKATIDSKVASGGTFDPTNYYDKTATDALLDNKFDASAFTSYSAATDARISEDEEVTAAGLNALNESLSGKQDTLIAGSGITISGNVISAEGGNLVIELTQAEYDALVDKDPNAFYIITDATEINISDYYTSAQTQSAINAAVSGKQDTLIAGSGITISGNVISANGGGSITVDTALDSGSTNPVENRVIYNKFDEVEQVTAAALNDLNEALSGKADSSDVTEAINSAVSGKADTSSVYTKSEVDTALNAKQNTLVSGTNIKTINNESILGSGNIDIQGGGGKAIVAGRGISITTGETADTVSFSLPISAGTGSNSIICGSNDNKASGKYSFAGGEVSSATSFWSFAYGAGCKSGNGAWAGGYQSQANGSYSFAIGERTKTSNDSECSIGHYNVTNAGSTNDLKTLFSVGNGTSVSARHNAFEIRQNGDIYCSDGTNDVKLQDTITATAANTTALGGLKLVKLTQSEYDALATKDSNTLFVIVN